MSEVDHPGDATPPPVGRRSRVAPFVALVVAVVLAGLFVVLMGAKPSTDETAETPLMDRAAPEAVGTLGDGSIFDLARRKGDWLAVNFFQSECIPCQQEHPELVRFAAQQAALGADGARLVTVVFDDSKADVDAFFAAEGGDWPVVFDEDGSISTAFGVSKVPETWIIDPGGFVRARIISRVSADFLSNQLQVLREQLG